MTRTFADSFHYLALANPRDSYHLAAIRTTANRSGMMVTTHWVLTEVADALASPHLRPRFLDLLSMLKADRLVEIAPATADLFERGIELYRHRPDKDWPLTDCLSFVVMQERGITEALTSDAHFVQAGFVALLAE